MRVFLNAGMTHNKMKLNNSYEYIIIGSGFGGAFAAYNLARAGKEVLVVERGAWVKRDETCSDEYALHLAERPLYQGQTPYYIDQKAGKKKVEYPYDTVGGMSTFYGCAAFRMREDDFDGAPLPDSDARDHNFAWPFGYKDLEPFYDQAETLQYVAGEKGEDITEPPRGDFPQKPEYELSPPSKLMWETTKKMGLHPFRLPLAINFKEREGRKACILCPTCDHFLCPLEAKNDLSVVVLPDAIKAGATVASNTRAIKINTVRGEAVSVTLVDQLDGKSFTVRMKRLILAGGALSTPHLMMSSGMSTASGFLGRHLMRHVNGVVNGVFFRQPNKEQIHQKMLGIADYYYGDPEKKIGPSGPWGLIQEVASIGKGLIKKKAQWGIRTMGAFCSDYTINLLCIGEDMPLFSNRVYPDEVAKDKYGMPILNIYHRYHERDIAVRKELCKRAWNILRTAGAKLKWFIPIDTFSHALGTCMMGTNPNKSVVDPECRVWGYKNIYVTDGSCMPSGGSVNPSLTIGANALRVAKILAEKA